MNWQKQDVGLFLLVLDQFACARELARVWPRCVCAGGRESGRLLACDESDRMTLQGGDATAVLTRWVSGWGRPSDGEDGEKEE